MAINRDQWQSNREKAALAETKLFQTQKQGFFHCSTMAKTIDRTKNLIPAKQSKCNYIFELTLKAMQTLTGLGSILSTTDAERAKKPKFPNKKLLKQTHQKKAR